MKRRSLAPCLGLLLAACGSRADLSALEVEPEPGPGPRAEPPSGLVEFPSIEETAAVPEPATPPNPRRREDGFGTDLARECELAVPSLDSVLARIQTDVLAQRPEDRPFLRYLSAAIWLPNYCRIDTAVSVVADALPLLLNSLSLRQDAARAQLLDGEEGLLRLDLRELGWDRPIRIDGRRHADGWEALSANAAQAVALRGPEADALADVLGTRTPLLHASDFASAALDAGVYYALLNAPETLGELRSSLDIPPDLDAEPNAYWRAITTRSRISRQDRILLRYRGPVEGPFFWQTLERLPNGASDAFVDPLARQGDESTVVYTLPNGLPAYFLADADGQRLDESRVLMDTNENDFVPRTAPSCVRCHSQDGVLPVVDELRAYAATDPNRRFDARELALLAEVYPEQKDLDSLFEADRRRVAGARARLGVPAGSGGGPLDELLLHYNQDLDPTLAAAELFISPAELQSRRDLPGPLRVLTSTGNLGRPSFNDTYPQTLCALSTQWRNQPTNCP